jgi:excisionase family DNA binding protein
MMEPYLTITQVSEILNVNYRTIRDLIHTKKIPSIKIGRVYRISRAHLNQFIAKCESSK